MDDMARRLTKMSRFSEIETSNFRRAIFQMLFARAVDGFLTYLSGVVWDVLSGAPEMLSDEAKIDYGVILNASDLEELRSHATELAIRKKRDSIGYGGIKEARRWFSNAKLLPELEDSEWATINEWVATRNIIVHNNGSVNEIYKETVPDSKLALDEERLVSKDELLQMQSLFVKAVRALDEKVGDRFTLGRRTLRDWQQFSSEAV
ncbi:MAG: hypothetical protein NDJ92_12140 [Thermoanaerobaculia bacterium]|nr:hypothetical protein [Thermoanaerobaculia bacterium]